MTSAAQPRRARVSSQPLRLPVDGAAAAEDFKVDGRGFPGGVGRSTDLGRTAMGESEGGGEVGRMGRRIVVIGLPAGHVTADVFVEDEADERVDATVETCQVHDQNDESTIRNRR